MADATQILFNTFYNGKVLFKRQFDLVQELLNTPESSYYVHKNENEKYEREAIRLKTLISQLLSSTVSRNIPPEFPRSLNVIIQKKISDITLADKIIKDVVEDLKTKNESIKFDIKQLSYTDQIKTDFNDANYTAIITGNPLEIELDVREDRFSLRKLFIDSFLECISKPQPPLKKYRILLPLDQTCFLFWKGLKEVVLNHFTENAHNNHLIKFIHERYYSYNQYDESDSYSNNLPFNEYAERLTSSMITLLNNDGTIVVFSHNSPLFPIPTIVIDPADFKRSKVYILLDSDKEEPLVHSYSPNEIILWRLFVWDRIKTKQYSGKRIDFVTAMND